MFVAELLDTGFYPVVASFSYEATHKNSSTIGVPKGIRTPVPTVKGWCPRPLDDGDPRTEL